jgi:hypothetical protein
MSESLRTLLTGLIDYAGLFPPAKLPLREALANHVHYRAGGYAWMLGRFICPATRLGELVELKELFHTGAPLVISALGRGGASANEFLTGLSADLADIAACRQEHTGWVVVDTLETRLPADIDVACATLEGTAKLVRSAGLTLYFETPAPYHETLRELLGVIHAAFFFTCPAGFKLRTGGLEPAAFPSSEQIAFALSACLAEGVPFKATAGLHHPLPSFDSTIGVRMHGFINLFTAGVLVHTRGIGADKVCAILDDDDPLHFSFSESGLEWQGLSASTEEIAQARQNVLSFGSCSFDEPRDDLRALGWL